MPLCFPVTTASFEVPLAGGRGEWAIVASILSVGSARRGRRGDPSVNLVLGRSGSALGGGDVGHFRPLRVPGGRSPPCAALRVQGVSASGCANRLAPVSGLRRS